MKIGIYNRYWSTCGGGEKYTGSIAEVLSQDHDVELISVDLVDWDRIQSRLRLDLSRCSFKQWPNESCARLSPLTAQYDLFINSTYSSSMMPRSTKSALICYFPHRIDYLPPKISIKQWIKTQLETCRMAWNKDAALLTQDLPNLKPQVSLSTYSRIISISEFTTEWIGKRWNLPSFELPPPIDTDEFSSNFSHAKKRIILSVGRFFAGGHNKKHHEMAEAFIRMRKEGHIPQDWRLCLVGSRHHEHPSHLAYFDQLVALSAGHPIDILPDLPFVELQDYYRKASIYWHATGWGENIEQYPERFEHFGMTTCEAMACGCVPVVFDAAGQREIVNTSEVGFRYSNYEMLARQMEALTKADPAALFEIGQKAQASISRYARSAFPEKVRNAFRELAY